MWEISVCLFLDQDLFCVTKQIDQAIAMCECDDLSYSQDWKEADTLPEEVIIS